MKPPTQKQITAEIAKLTKMKPKVRRRSGFGDDHHAAIDAQIYVLTERSDLDDIYDAWAEEDHASNVQEAAVEACHWMTGENAQQAPSKGWAELVR